VEYKILFTEDALIDLEVILDYIRDDNPTVAARFGATLLDSLQILLHFWHAARESPV
jgi:plasmid stabilization system protein ParE